MSYQQGENMGATKRGFNEFSEDEMRGAVNRFQSKIVQWIEEEGILCGSCNGYDLYLSIRQAMTGEWTKSQHQHGKEMDCPRCGAKGKYDEMKSNGRRPEFADAIWFNNHSHAWECHECWMK
jgi:hypothetical protein